MAFSYKKRSDGGFDFFNPQGMKTTIEDYSRNTGANINQLRGSLAQQGDKQSQSIVSKLPAQFSASAQPQIKTPTFNATNPIASKPVPTDSTISDTIKRVTSGGVQKIPQSQAVQEYNNLDVMKQRQKLADLKGLANRDKFNSQQDVNNAQWAQKTLDDVQKNGMNKGGNPLTFAQDFVAGTQQGLSSVADIALQNQGLITSGFGLASPEWTNAAMGTVEKLRGALHGGTDINGNKLAGVSGADVAGGRIASGNGNLQDFATVGGEGLNVANTATMFINPTSSVAKTAAGQTIARSLIPRVAKESALYGGTSGTQAGLQTYGQTGDLGQSIQAAGTGLATGAIAQAGLGIGAPILGEAIGGISDLSKGPAHAKLMDTNPVYRANNEKLTGIDATIARATANGDTRALEGLQAVKARLSDENVRIASTTNIDQSTALIPAKETQMRATSPEVSSKKLPQTNLSQQMPNEVSVTRLSGQPKTSAPDFRASRQQTQSQINAALNNTSTRERGFIETVVSDPKTAQHLKDNLTSLYSVRNTKDLQVRAKNLVRDNPDLAQRVAEAGNGDVSVAVGSELIKHLQSKGSMEIAIDVADKLATQLTEAGRTAQAASIYGKLTPAGVLRFAQRELKRYNDVNNITPGKQLKITTQQASKLSKMSAELQSLPDGRAKDIASRELVNEIYGLVPSSLARKVSTLQTIGQLLNPKTATRNIIGNSMFGITDNIAQVGAAGIDKAVSKLRGTPRTVTLPNIKTQYQGLKSGGKQAYEEVMRGVNLGPNTQFELGDVPTFRKGLLGKLEKTMGVELRVPDRAAYQAAFDDTVRGLTKANKLDAPTPEILELAHANGLYRTFQDNSKAAQLFSKLKESLNYVGFEGKDGQRFGLGDLILKYPKTPGNILSRGLDYSPVGILKGVLEIVKPAITHKPFNQQAFSTAMSRGIVGSGGIMGAGVVLGSLGIITEAPNTDTDARNLQKASGQGGYQINVDALRRFVMSGFDKEEAKLKEGDNLVSYDWAQPLSIPLSAGAAIGSGKNAGDGAVSTLDTASQGLNTLVEQPLVTGVNTFANNIKNKGVVGATAETLKGAPASFVPTLLNQGKQLTDNTKRNTYDPNPVVQSLNMMSNKIPGVSYLLSPQVNSLGKNNEAYQGGSNNIFNVAVNPAFVSQYKPDEAAKLPLGIMNDTGETKQIPTTTKTSQKVNGESINLTAKQNEDFQRYVGQKTSAYLDNAANDPKFMSLSQEDQAKKISATISDIQSAARIELLGDQPKKSSAAVKAIVKNGTANMNVISSDLPKNVASSAKSVLETYDTLDTETRKTWNTEKSTDKGVTDSLQSWIGDKAKIPEVTNEVAKAWADYQKDYADGKISKLKMTDQKKTILKKAFNSQLSTDEKEISSLTKSELAYYRDNGVITDENINNAIAVEKQMFDAGLISKETLQRNVGIAARGYKSSTSSTGKKTTKTTIASILAGDKSINQTNNDTYTALSKLLGGISSTTSKNKIGREVTLKKISVKGAKA